METAYAQALWQMIEDGAKPHEAVASLKKTLQAKGRMALLPRIGRAFERLAARKLSGSKMTLTVAREKDAKVALKEAKEVLTQLGAADFDLCEAVDDSLIGGWRLEGRGVLVDQSWKKSLLSIYNAATK
jgi:F0F1-type ATP synthase delta subunit